MTVLKPSSSVSPSEEEPDLVPQVVARLLLNARHDAHKSGGESSGAPLRELPPSLVPENAAQAYEIQDLVRRELEQNHVPYGGPVVAWKVGASSPQAEPVCAPIHRGTVFASGAVIPDELCHVFGAEAELGFRLSRALPPRATPWTREEVEEAIGSVHAVIELVDSRFETFGSQPALTHLADQASHGALVIGYGRRNWRDFNPAELNMKMWIDGKLAYDQSGTTPAGDPVRLLVWLANQASRRGLGLPAEVTIITGSTMGSHFVGPGTALKVLFSGLPEVTASIAPASPA
ncbi:2-keto-4-pentenoate hydratase [Oecophyllibacter saccharovorans]|uniref:2-keto-4-pentenoate hydratase n=1 Tax=Oecophyllibacter saccharovorans TaxID=2558360 RepID=UPI0011728D37|nr:fumarylacetoacetate hydrolase family protein [Oecophyllibacter saccharovorans]TPW33694.1 2-keto-4-pentenoate hydratase [Oecophyllibacter saccharovorans]